MDCKDLTICDYVKHNGVIKIVDSVYLYSVSVHDPSKPWGVASSELVSVDDIEPVELTDDILVKNGFERCDYNNKYFIIDDAINLITPKWRGGTEYYACAWFQDEFDDLVQHIEICKCAYVHQLQRLLRLCGVEKELTI